MKIPKLLTLLILLSPGLIYSQDLTEEERKLYDLLIAYRKEKDLPGIPLSKSLTYVAQVHVIDLADNKPDLGDCTAHSWSSNGSWTSCCYTPDHKESECMRNKPSELTPYKGSGFEIASGSNDCCPDYVMTAEYAVNGWKKSSGHNAVMINLGIWKDKEWKAVGVGLYKGFAVIWFGVEVDESK